jgi:hypothetical protein
VWLLKRYPSCAFKGHSHFGPSSAGSASKKMRGTYWLLLWLWMGLNMFPRWFWYELFPTHNTTESHCIVLSLYKGVLEQGTQRGSRNWGHRTMWENCYIECTSP